MKMGAKLQNYDLKNYIYNNVVVYKFISDSRSIYRN